MATLQDSQRQLLKDVLKDESVWDDFFCNPQYFAQQHGVSLDAATIAAVTGRLNSDVDDLNGPRTIAQWASSVASVAMSTAVVTAVVNAVGACTVCSSWRPSPADERAPWRS